MLNRLVEGSFVNGFKVFTFLWNAPFPKCPSRVQKHRLEFALLCPSSGVRNIVIMKQSRMYERETQNSMKDKLCSCDIGRGIYLKHGENTW